MFYILYKVKRVLVLSRLVTRKFYLCGFSMYLYGY